MSEQPLPPEHLRWACAVCGAKQADLPCMMVVGHVVLCIGCWQRRMDTRGLKDKAVTSDGR